MSLIRLPKHYKETVISKPNAIANGLANAAQTATKFITEISNSGIWVTPDGAQPSDGGSALPTTTGWHISDAIELFRQGSSYFKIWLENSVTKVRVGLESSGHALFTPNGMDIFNGGESVARFGGNGTRIGKATGESHILQDYHSLQMVDKEGNTYFHVSDLRDANGDVVVSATHIGNGSTTVFKFDYVVDLNSVAVFVDGTEVTSGWTASDGTSFPDVNSRVTFTTAPASDSEILLTATLTDHTFTPLMKGYTLGVRSDTNIGPFSLATGYHTSARGWSSQAHGEGTVAVGKDTAVFGRYNALVNKLLTNLNSGLYGLPLAVGAGTSKSNRRNILELDWSGNFAVAGEVIGQAGEEEADLTSAVDSCTTYTVRRSCNVVTLNVIGLKLASALANGAASSILMNVPSGVGTIGGRDFRPSSTVYAQVVTSGHDLGSTYARIGTDGAVTIRNQSGASIPTTYSLAFTLTYVR